MRSTAAKPFALTTAIIVSCFLLTACMTTQRNTAVPVNSRTVARIPGIPNARFYTDQLNEIMQEQAEALVREANFKGVKKGGVIRKTYGLTLSGGADNGAFGAGLLVGWSKHGDRPEFKLVTGISTGALIAPFAFLGSKYDDKLAQVYTTLDKTKVYRERLLPVAALAQDALSDTDPLYYTISSYLDENLLNELAAEYNKGRLLVIQTTDLDAGRPVIWNIGAIAASGRPESLTLIRKILLASAAIPAAFPPVMFDVEINGEKHQELHVDGGAVSQSFLAPAKLNLSKALGIAGYRHEGFGVYVIRNGKLHTEWSEVGKKTLSIAQRAVNVLTNYSGVSDLYKIYMITKASGSDFNLAYIPDDYSDKHEEEFDPAYMNNLFYFAYEKAAKGYSWDKAPPGFNRKDD